MTEPGPVPCMKLEHQIAQKLHAVSGAGSERAHDLIDLQIIVNNGNVDYGLACRTCKRLFAYRKEQAWPPTIVKGEGWDALYAAQAEGLGVPSQISSSARSGGASQPLWQTSPQSTPLEAPRNCAKLPDSVSG